MCVSSSGYTKTSPSSLDLTCTYSQRSQVRSVRWSHVQNPSRPLQSAGVPGRISTFVPLPVTPETAGEYACTLYLKNGKSVQYIYSLQMSNIGEKIDTQCIYFLLLPLLFNFYLLFFTVSCLKCIKMCQKLTE